VGASGATITRLRARRLLSLALAGVLAGVAAAAGDAPAQRESGCVRVGRGVRLHYLAASPASPAPAAGPSLLFVPGWMMPAEAWEGQLAHFGRRRRAVAVDPRGQGLSSKRPRGHLPATRARDLHRLIRRLDLAPVVLVATGMAVADAAAYVEQFGTADLAALALVQGVAGADYARARPRACGAGRTGSR
jgi:microsomal epoxide hydrolase